MKAKKILFVLFQEPSQHQSIAVCVFNFGPGFIQIILCILGTTPHDQTTQSNDNTTDWAPDPMCPYPSDEFVYFPYEGDCGKYWACYAGNKYEYTCPDGLWWNQAISVCDYPENVVCDDNSTSINSFLITRAIYLII